MAASTTTVSLRLPPKTRKNLDRAAKITRRSRSFIMKEALDRHLPAIVGEQTRVEHANRLARILAMAGAGAAYSTYKSADEVIAQIREFRGDE